MKTAEELVKEKGIGLISVGAESTIHDALQLMVKHRIGAIFVKEKNSITGVWSERDLVKNVKEEHFDIRKALIRNYMVTDLQTAPHTDTTYSLMEKFRKLRIRHLLIEKFGKIIGLISPGDVMVEKNKEIESLNRELEANIENLNRANQLTKLSEEKYRRLVEGSNDMIFTLDDKWQFTNANDALKSIFKFNTDNIKSLNFFDYVHDDINDELSISKQLVQKKMQQFAEDRKPIQFIADFKTSKLIEPKRLVVKLEYINIEGKNEILGKAGDIIEDELLRFFQFEKKKFTIGNSLLTADDITRRITHNLHKFIPHKEIDLLRIALREMIINAIEHGNLNITFDEKSKSMMDGTYLDLINDRRYDPRYKGRKVLIEYLIDNDKAVYKIADEGAGFDHQSITERSLKSANEGALSHGRGIAMANNIFDTVKYNEKGNQVLLAKRY